MNPKSATVGRQGRASRSYRRKAWSTPYPSTPKFRIGHLGAERLLQRGAPRVLEGNLQSEGVGVADRRDPVCGPPIRVDGVGPRAANALDTAQVEPVGAPSSPAHGPAEEVVADEVGDVGGRALEQAKLPTPDLVPVLREQDGVCAKATPAGVRTAKSRMPTSSTTAKPRTVTTFVAAHRASCRPVRRRRPWARPAPHTSAHARGTRINAASRVVSVGSRGPYLYSAMASTNAAASRP